MDYLETKPRTPVVEMDTIKGRKGESVILTFYFRNCSIQLFFKRVVNTSYTVIEMFNQLYNFLGHDDFTSLFPCILTDNGSEFSNSTMIENNIVFNDDGTIQSQVPQTKLFYCDPKGTSLDEFTPSQIQVMINHINSYKRTKKDGMSHFHLYRSL